MALPVVCILGRGLSAAAARCLGEGYRGCGSTVCPQASYEVPDIAEAMTFQNIGGEIASQSDTAEEPYRLAGRYLAQPLPHIVEWDVDGSRYGTCRELYGCADINECHACSVRLLHLSPVEGCHLAAENVSCHIGRYGHRVFGRGEWRGVGVLKRCEMSYSVSMLYGEGILVDACVDTVIAYYLRPIEPPVVRGECYLDVHLLCSGIVRCVRCVVDCRREVWHTHIPEALGRQPDGCHGDVEDLGYGGAYGSLISYGVAIDHIVCHDACLPVGWPGKEVEPWPPCQRVWCLYRVAHGIDTLGGCLEILIDIYATHLAQPYPRFLGEMCLCPHSDR